MSYRKKQRHLFLFLMLFIFVINVEISWSAVELTNTGAENRFGKVKAPPRSLSWKVLKTAHFEIYFYQGMEELALRCREILEREAYDRIFPDFKSFFTLNPYRKIRIILFTSRKEYQNAQANGLPLSTSSEGVANILTNRIVAIRQPTLQDLRCVLTHEVTHLITLGPFRSSLLSSAGGQAPGWMAEGLAEYYEPNDTRFFMREVALRDAVLRDELHTLDRLTQIGGNLDYAEAWSLVDFIARNHGREKLSELLKGQFSRGDKDSTYHRILGIGKKELWENWKAELEERYVEGKDNVSIKEEFSPLIEGYGQQKAPKMDKDGRVFFLSTHQSKFYDLYMWEKGESRRLTEQTVITYDLSPDGEEVIFISDHDGERRFYKVEIRTGEITPFPIELSNPINVAWSPRGDRLAVAVNTRGDADLYIIDLQGKVLNKVAGSPIDELAPAWSPNGEELVYVITKLGHNQLAIWNGESNTPLTATNKEHMEPYWGTDGKIYCVYGEKGYYRAVKIIPESGEIIPISNFRETIINVSPRPDGEFLSEVYTAQEFKIYLWAPKGVEVE